MATFNPQMFNMSNRMNVARSPNRMGMAKLSPSAGGKGGAIGSVMMPMTNQPGMPSPMIPPGMIGPFNTTTTADMNRAPAQSVPFSQVMSQLGLGQPGMQSSMGQAGMMPMGQMQRTQDIQNIIQGTPMPQGMMPMGSIPMMGQSMQGQAAQLMTPEQIAYINQTRLSANSPGGEALGTPAQSAISPPVGAGLLF